MSESETARSESETARSESETARADGFDETDAGIELQQRSSALLDPNFSGDGMHPAITSVAAYGVDDTGNYVVGEKNGFMAIAKLAWTNTSVALDTTFGPTSSQPGVVEVPGLFDLPTYGTAAVTDGEGGVVVVGAITNQISRYMLFCRRKADGSGDARFFNGSCIGPSNFGISTINHAIAADVARASDGTFVAGGFARAGYLADGTTAGAKLAVVKFRKDGTFDTSFSDDGKVVTDITSSSGEGVSDVLVQPDGKVVVVGWGTKPGAGASVVLARYLTNGALDTSFAGIGKVHTQLDSNNVTNAHGVLVNGALYVVGSASRDGVAYFTLAKFKADGIPDTSFGANGVRVAPVSQALVAIRSVAYSAASQQLIVSGSTNDGRTVGLRVSTTGGISNREVVKFAKNTIGISGRELPVNGKTALRLYGLAHVAGQSPVLYVSQNTVTLPTTPAPPMEPPPTPLPPGGIGDSCGQGQLCQSGLVCSPTELICVHPIPGLCNDLQDACCDACAAGGTVCDTANRYYCLDGYQCTNRIAGGTCKY